MSHEKFLSPMISGDILVPASNSEWGSANFPIVFIHRSEDLSTDSQEWIVVFDPEDNRTYRETTRFIEKNFVNLTSFLRSYDSHSEAMKKFMEAKRNLEKRKEVSSFCW